MKNIKQKIDNQREKWKNSSNTWRLKVCMYFIELVVILIAIIFITIFLYSVDNILQEIQNMNNSYPIIIYLVGISLGILGAIIQQAKKCVSKTQHKKILENMSKMVSILSRIDLLIGYIFAIACCDGHQKVLIICIVLLIINLIIIVSKLVLFCHNRKELADQTQPSKQQEANRSEGLQKIQVEPGQSTENISEDLKTNSETHETNVVKQENVKQRSTRITKPLTSMAATMAIKN